MNKLIEIQKDLKAPKGQFNSFGKYNYRSCEDILEAVKPLLHERGLTLTMTDEVKEAGGLVYVEATARLMDENDLWEVRAQAGIEPNRKGMDLSQTFGAASSYARKYALNGLFLIDDNKDGDKVNKHDDKVDNRKPLFPGSDKWSQAVESLKNKRSTMASIEKYYSLTPADKKKLQNEVQKSSK